MTIHIIPGTGCGHLSELISIMISCSEKFVVVLDYDNEGRAAFNKYNHYFGDSFKNRCYQYEGVRNNKDFVLENMLSAKDATMIKSSMGCDDIKNTIVALYFLDEGIKIDIVNRIDSGTKRNIDIIQRRISTLFK